MISYQTYMFVTILFALFLTACEKKLEEPETLDPIYQSIQNEIENIKSQIHASELRLKEIPDELNDFEVRNPMRFRLRQEMFTLKNQRRHLREKLLAYEIRKQKRQHQVRLNYKKSLITGKDWQSSRDWEDYSHFKGLQSKRQ